MEQVECIVVGAGVVGLAVARALAMAGREVIVLERASGIGSETSSRNSEVIHAGIYYPAGSRKARTCVIGRERLYAYCVSHGVPHRRCGKLIVATEAEQLQALDGIAKAAAANGVHDVRPLSRMEAVALEPELHCISALLSPSTGIIDSHAYMLALQGDLEAHGGFVALNAEVTGGCSRPGCIRIAVTGTEQIEIECRVLVNCAGLHAQMVAASIDGVPSAAIPPAHLAKGNYFVLEGKSPFSRLVYPVPSAGGLGVHSTVDLAGRTRFGPDVEWIETINYDVDPSRGAVFYEAIRRYWPGLRDGVLAPGYAGIRPKLQRAGKLAGDFLLQGPAEHGVAGLVNLYGMESPGLTASLAIADEVLILAGLQRCSARPERCVRP